MSKINGNEPLPAVSNSIKQDYRTKKDPYEFIKAFEWPSGIGLCIATPQRFCDALASGEVIVERRGDNMYLINQKSVPGVAVPGDFITVNQHGAIGILPARKFHQLYELVP